LFDICFSISDPTVDPAVQGGYLAFSQKVIEISSALGSGKLACSEMSRELHTQDDVGNSVLGTSRMGSVIWQHIHFQCFS
jgi:hypothetical protein